MTRFSIEQRVVACIQAVAVGDAMGKMTEGFWSEEVPSVYGAPVTDFKHPLYPRGSKNKNP